MIQNQYMTKNAAVTIRLPGSLKRNLEDRAQKQQRSLSAQVLHDLEMTVKDSARPVVAGKILGLFQGSRMPTEQDLKHVRSLLWGHLGRRQENRG